MNKKEFFKELRQLLGQPTPLEIVVRDKEMQQQVIACADDIVTRVKSYKLEHGTYPLILGVNFPLVSTNDSPVLFAILNHHMAKRNIPTLLVPQKNTSHTEGEQ